MYELYDFLIGPGVWIAFSVFIGGLVCKIIFFCGLSYERDKIIYHHINLFWWMKSIFHWLVPLGSISFRKQPVFGLVFYIFHLFLFMIPLFLLAHNILWQEAVGFNLPSLSDIVADYSTFLIMICILFLFVRRLVRPEVRAISKVWDYLLLLLVLSPFLSGYLTYHQCGNYELMMILHIVTGELMLIIVPFSKLSHIILFFFTRGFIGQEMGARRENGGCMGAKVW